VRVVDRPCNASRKRVDIPSGSVVFATLVASTILAIRLQQVNVVAADIGLGQIDDRLGQADFTVMVCGVFSNVTNKLSDLRLIREKKVANGSGTYFDFLLHVALEATPHNFPLTRLESIGNGRNGTNVVGHREQNQLLVDELRVGNLFQPMVQVSSRLMCGLFSLAHCQEKTEWYLELAQPFLALVRLFLAESELDELSIALLRGGEGNHVLLHVAKIVASVRIFARSQTLEKVSTSTTR
jgi:hypothetical protein